MLPPFESDDCEDDQHGIPRRHLWEILLPGLQVVGLVGDISAHMKVHNNVVHRLFRITNRILTLWNPRATTVDSPPFCRPDHGRPEST